MTMRVAIYARYSSDMQSDHSIEDQLRLCREKAERDGWTVVKSYEDRATSGATLMRPGIQSLMSDARSGSFDIVVAEALDRISRDQEHVAGFYKQLQFAAIPLVTLSEGEITPLFVGLKGTMNSIFLKDLADKTRRGLRGRVEAGKAAGGISFGYSVVPTYDARGERIYGDRKIVEEEAKVVRRIFIDFAAGKSPRSIAAALNDERVPGPRGGTWTPSTINGNKSRGNGILNNELYIGKLVWNRQSFMKDPDTDKRVPRLNDPSKWVTQDVAHLRILDDELWQSVKSRQEAVTRGTRPEMKDDRPFWSKARPRFLFSGLMKCGSCGHSYVKINANQFGCAAVKDRGEAVCTNRLTIRHDDLESTILNSLRHHLLHPDIFKVFSAEFVAETNRLRMESTADIDADRAELEKINRRIAKIVKSITVDDMPSELFHDEAHKLNDRRKQLETKLSAISEPAAPLLHPNLPEIYRQKVDALHVALNDDKSRLEAMEHIRALVDQVILSPVDGKLQIELKGELAGILAICDAGKKKPGSISEAGLAADKIKMVAGRGYRRYLHLDHFVL
jgi:DNA invertase Pin-like site-specific DNA recombinase